MSNQEVGFEILSLATEDWFALWEIVSRCELLLSGADKEAVEEVVRQEVLRLIAEGLVYLCEFTPQANECAQYSATEAEAVLNDPRTWQLPTSHTHPRVGATDAGMSEYFGESH